MPGPGGEGGGGGVPAAHSSKTIHGIEMKFGKAVENHKLINLVLFNWQITSLLCYNDIIIVKFWIFMKSCNQN